MTLDLEELLEGWNAEHAAVGARAVNASSGEEFIQLRIELGLLQMHLVDRPDGARYAGHPTTLGFVQHELRLGGEVSADDWRALDREIAQLNYRRIAAAALADESLAIDDPASAERRLAAVVTDVEQMLAAMDLTQRHAINPSAHFHLRGPLILARTRAACQRSVLGERYTDAVDLALEGAAALRAVEDDCDPDQLGVEFLEDLAQRLRLEYGVGLTLREQLDAALAAEDYETATELRRRLADDAA